MFRFIFSTLSILLLPMLAHADSNKELPQGSKVIFFGDSITQQGTRPGGYVDLFSKAVSANIPERDIEISGAGVGGNKTPDLLARIERDVLSKNPTHVVIYIGINDVWHWLKPNPVSKTKREGTKPDDYKVDLLALTRKLQAEGIKVILCTPSIIGENIAAEQSTNKILDQYSEIVREVATETRSELIDLRKTFVAFLGENNPESRE